MQDETFYSKDLIFKWLEETYSPKSQKQYKGRPASRICMAMSVEAFWSHNPICDPIILPVTPISGEARQEYLQEIHQRSSFRENGSYYLQDFMSNGKAIV